MVLVNCKSSAWWDSGSASKWRLRCSLQTCTQYNLDVSLSIDTCGWLSLGIASAPVAALRTAANPSSHLLGRILLASLICSIQLLLRRAINAPHRYFYYPVSLRVILPLYSLLLMPYHILECAVGHCRAGHRARHVKSTTRTRRHSSSGKAT